MIYNLNLRLKLFVSIYAVTAIFLLRDRRYRGFGDEKLLKNNAVGKAAAAYMQSTLTTRTMWGKDRGKLSSRLQIVKKPIAKS